MTHAHVFTWPDVTTCCRHTRVTGPQIEDAEVRCSAQLAAFFSCGDFLGEVQFFYIVLYLVDLEF